MRYRAVPYAGRGHFVTRIAASPWASRWSARRYDRDQRERQSKGYTSHEVTALRAGGPAGWPSPSHASVVPNQDFVLDVHC
jgi:hypothetical protein